MVDQAHRTVPGHWPHGTSSRHIASVVKADAHRKSCRAERARDRRLDQTRTPLGMLRNRRSTTISTWPRLPEPCPMSETCSKPVSNPDRRACLRRCQKATQSSLRNCDYITVTKKGFVKTSGNRRRHSTTPEACTETGRRRTVCGPRANEESISRFTLQFRLTTLAL